MGIQREVTRQSIVVNAGGINTPMSVISGNTGNGGNTRYSSNNSKRPDNVDNRDDQSPSPH